MMPTESVRSSLNIDKATTPWNDAEIAELQAFNQRVGSGDLARDNIAALNDPETRVVIGEQMALLDPEAIGG